MATERLLIEDLLLSGGTQPRVQVNEEVIAEYAELLLADPQFEMPSISVARSGDLQWPWDGFHRIYAYKKAGRLVIPATVKNGSLRDAQLWSKGANEGHGLRRTDADKRAAVTDMMMDAEWVKWSDRVIAEHCKVSHPLVAKIRAEISTGNDSSSNSQRTGKDGKQRPSTTTVYCKRCQRLGNPVKDCQGCKDARDVSRKEKEEKQAAKEAEQSAKQKAKEEREQAAAAAKAEKDRQRSEKQAEKEKANAEREERRRAKQENQDADTASDQKRTKTENPEYDGLPKSVANALADTWHAECAKLLSRMRKECKSAFSWSSWLDAAVLDHLKAAEECFLTAVPKKVCPDCKGQKTVDKKACLTCRQGGYLASQS